MANFLQHGLAGIVDNHQSGAIQLGHTELSHRGDQAGSTRFVAGREGVKITFRRTGVPYVGPYDIQQRLVEFPGPEQVTHWNIEPFLEHLAAVRAEAQASYIGYM